MDKLEALASVSRLSENVIRVLGQNPGKFTLQGTNTYIIGRQRPFTLIDTDPDVSDIVISHWHHDHVGGLPAVLALLRPPRLHKFPLTAAPHPYDKLPSIIESLPPAPSPDPRRARVHDLHDAQVVSPASQLRDNALYTADTVLGQAPPVFEDLAAYIVIATYIKHRLEREAQIVGILGTPPPTASAAAEDSGSHPWTTWTLVTTMYAGYPESLWLPAAGKLEGEDTSWEFVVQ
ncbi:hypothetical protein K438DRAFT_1799045 [Mycena galopus ATCC 62051]|nr:hypothetical protein K438DRAFT_1799045 [Mycena galopus ATCC 62051]